jgi:hypothetical protein
VVMWGKIADVAERFLKKGQEVAIEIVMLGKKEEAAA